MFILLLLWVALLVFLKVYFVIIVGGFIGLLYFSMGEELMNDILAHAGGPMGASGYASIVVVDGIFGEGKSQEHFMEASMELLNFTKELSEVI